MPLVVPSSRRPFVSRLLKKISFLGHGKRLPVMMELHPDALVDLRGLPGDAPSDVLKVMTAIAGLMEADNISWCVAGDLLLLHYRVPLATHNIEILVPPEHLEQARDIFNANPDFVYPFRPPHSHYTRHVRPFPRFRVKGMNQCFSLIPASCYGLDAQVFADVMHLPHIEFLPLSLPILPLPHYVRGLATVAALPGSSALNNFDCQLEYLIDGMDIDEEWCDRFLTDDSRGFVRKNSTRVAKKERMGSHFKYDGNLTTYIRNETERSDILGITGRVSAVTF